ncbi:complement receptor type 1-like isoform X2 [Mauremys reevesii]|uniref:complement receptor type 1-like isoform X2 n=1 Tax=Mauremys reevesii TaxID=260615 RepID=UPI00193F5B7D|nr:complement receptor type 1-like isoform X2 [Mauremys reevesii]
MGGHAWGPCCIGRRVRSGCSPAWTALSPPFSGNSPGTMMSLPSGWTLLLLGTLVLMLLPGGALSYCVDPPDIPNAVRKTNVGTLIPPGMVIRYGCRPGYKLIPGRRQGHVTCLQNLTWSSAPNFCQKVRCPAPDVNNGTPKPMPRPGEETYAFEDRVTIKCDLGYDIKDSINGNAQIHCKHDGTWDPAVPVCEPVCAQPPNILHGQYNDWGKRGFFVGSSVTYKCDRGFSLVGKASIQCIAGDEVTPTWSEPTPQCEETQCPVPHIQHGSLKSPLPLNYTHRTNVTFQCDPGYTLRGADRIHCQADGKWYPQLPACDPACEPPARIANGWDKRGRKNVFLVGSRVSYSCDPGWSLVGVSSIRCTAGDGGTLRWDAPVPECKACEPPARISNGRDDRGWKNDFLVGSSVSYSCNRGWSLVGVSSIQCTAGDGGTPRWDAPAPECKACEPPARISNGRDDRGWEKAFPVGSRVSYSCNRDWSLVGVSSILCIAGDGGTPRWNASAPECKGSVLNTTDNSAEPQGEDIITQDKPTTVPPKGAEVAGTSSGSAMNIAGNFAEPDGEGRVIVLAIGIVTGIGIVLGVVPAIIASAILKKNRIKVDAS